MLQTILPTATMLGVQVAMYADDFSLWNTGYSIPSLASNLSILINKHIVPWLDAYNMKLSIWKCHSFLFTLYHHDPKPCIVINDIQLSHGSTPQHNSLKLLGVHLDTQLTMKIHHNHLICQCANHLHQLSRVSNSIYGLDQVDLCTMYIAYICSILKYAAPVWSPCMSKTNVATLQWIQNQAIQTIIGT